MRNYLRGGTPAVDFGVGALSRDPGAGVPGGISQLKSYLEPYKHRLEAPWVRFETPPRQQMQVDFTAIRRGRSLLKAFVATLGRGRATFVCFGARG